MGRSGGTSPVRVPGERRGVRLLLPGCLEASVVPASASFWTALVAHGFFPRRCAMTGVMGVQTGPGSLFMRQSTVASGEFPAFLARVVHTRKFGAFFVAALYLAVLFQVSGCCQVLDVSGDAAFLWGAMLDSTLNTCSASVWDAFWTNCTQFLRCSGLES